jgi:hypothetical protein
MAAMIVGTWTMVTAMAGGKLIKPSETSGPRLRGIDSTMVIAIKAAVMTRRRVENDWLCMTALLSCVNSGLETAASS